MSSNALKIEYLDKLRLPKKRRRYADVSPTSLAAIPTEWRELLEQWLRLGGNSRWETLLKKAGLTKKISAETLLDWLLSNGWAIVDEERKHGDWWPYRVELRALKALRNQLGLPDMDDVATQWQNLRAELQVNAEDNASLLTTLSALDAMPISRAIYRATLVRSLLAWRTDERVGTYRDFSLFARAATKEISKTEWAWLDAHFDLAELNIERHTPLLLLSANIVLHTSLGDIHLSAMPDFAALTPATVKSIRSANSTVTTWILVENRTSFERVARNRQAEEGVIWLPGYPPSWWKEAVKHVINIAPAPAKIACDPDPAGIAIALSAIALCYETGNEAVAWKMSVEALESLTSKKPLSEFDNQQLAGLLKQTLPTELKVLADYMKVHQKKGEQEGYL
ncbi:MAG: hypothetical protein Q8N02_06625 [Methylotenera sp.]|nr:hypothetical protein [Methylotenera sp.]MDO9232882.1 hypothetical protein [Methylotenera sp.]MDO9389114.1 hypothetical protein [Methylotenera sp.]MDP2102872.1 hypothetical protein [Methylotenera sp.]MDP2282040.1 hypothetical protein [Methylotenera sp.]